MYIYVYIYRYTSLSLSRYTYTYIYVYIHIACASEEDCAKQADNADCVFLRTAIYVSLSLSLYIYTYIAILYRYHRCVYIYIYIHIVTLISYYIILCYIIVCICVRPIHVVIMCGFYNRFNSLRFNKSPSINDCSAAHVVMYLFQVKLWAVGCWTDS